MTTDRNERLRVIAGIGSWALITAVTVGIGLGMTLLLALLARGTPLESKTYDPLTITITCVLLLAGPASIFILGLRKRRLPMIGGPLFLLAATAATWALSRWVDFERAVQTVADLDTDTFLKPAQPHDLIFLEGSECDQICQKILGRTNYRVGVYESAAVIYRKVSDAECQANTAGYVRFPGLCAAREPASPDTRSALFVVTPRSWPVAADDAIAMIMPPFGAEAIGGTKGTLHLSLTGEARVQTFTGVWGFMSFGHLRSFSGTARALVERTEPYQWPDHVLGRWISGTVTVWPFRSRTIRKSFSREDFYAAALGVSME